MIPQLILVSFFILWYIFKTCTKPKDFPPGPAWLPFVGSSYIVKTYRAKYGCQHIALKKIAEEYNVNVLGLKLDRQNTIIVFGEENLRKIFRNEEFEGRPDTFFMKLRCFGKRRGITAMDGPTWKVLRNFTLKHLRDVGFGKTLMEDKILIELDQIIESLKRTSDGVNPRQLLAPAILNVLWQFATGERIQKEDQRLEKLLKIMDSRSKAFSMSGNVLNDMPWLRFIAPKLCGYTLISQMNTELSQLIQDSIMKHRESKVKGNDFTYEFLAAQEEFPSIYTDEQLCVIMLDLFIGGAQTTSASIDFAILMMIVHPEIQKKVHSEIDAIVGNGQIKWQDIVKMTYTQAVMFEIQRYFSIVPIMGPRRTLKDTTLDGFTIPKDTTILIGAHAHHHDEKVWGDPENFRPERHIDEKGALCMTDHMYHFGLGRRRCLGEVLAKYCMLIIFAGILQKFNVVKKGANELSTKPVSGLTHCAQNYLAKFELRA